MITKGKIAAILIAAIALIGLVLVMFQLDRWLTKPWEGDSGDGAHTVYIDGVAYEPREITNYLIIGLDEFGTVAEDGNGSYNNTKNGDFLALLSFNHSTKTYTLLHLNRDTMATVTRLGIGGEKVDERVEQLALAHTYGNGSHISCRNTATAVSGLLYGLSIDYYISMTMDAVAILNDYMGGVTVKVTDDLSELHPDFVQNSEVTLTGEQALLYVRARQGIEDGSNLSRMGRQRQYMDAFIKQVRTQDLSEEYFGGMYEAVMDYIVTNASLQTMDVVLEDLQTYTYGGMLSPQGEARKNDQTGFIEFYVDGEHIKSIVKAWYYEERK